MPHSAPRKIFIVSDGTGRTCTEVVRSALVQFDDEPINLILRPGVRKQDQINAVVKEAAKAKGIIFFTLVALEARRTMKDTANEAFVESVDVLGPVFSGLNSVINRLPGARPGLYYESERAYFDRIDAIDYTLKHDDGQRIHELRQADIVLVGVSRVSKSSTCFYLAYRGVRAANVPLLPYDEPQPELAALDPKRVVGLSVNCQRLQAIRQTRLHAMGVGELERYADAEAVSHEVRTAHDCMARHHWKRIDVSYMAIEEISKQVLSFMETTGLRRRPRRRRTRN